MLHFFRRLGLAQYCDSIRANEVDGPMLDDLIRTDGLAKLNIVSKLHASKVRSRFGKAMSPTGPDATPKSPADGDATNVAGDRGEDWPQHAERPEAPFDAGGQFSTPRRQPSEHFGVSLGGGPSRLEHSSHTKNRSRSPSVRCRGFRRIAGYRVRGVESLAEASDRVIHEAQVFVAGKGKKPNISDCKQGKKWQVPNETKQENQMLTRCRCNTHKGCPVWMELILTDRGEFEAWESFTSSHTAEWNVLRGRRNGSDVVKSPCTHAMKASVADTIEEMGREAATKLTPLQLKDQLTAAEKPTPPAQYLSNTLKQLRRRSHAGRSGAETARSTTDTVRELRKWCEERFLNIDDPWRVGNAARRVKVVHFTVTENTVVVLYFMPKFITAFVDLRIFSCSFPGPR